MDMTGAPKASSATSMDDTATSIPQETLAIWHEVGRGLERTLTVVWKSAVESLDEARKYFLRDDRARQFLNEHCATIVWILIAQNPTKIGIHERGCVQDSLLLAAKIVSEDLQECESNNANLGPSPCRTLEALGFLLNMEQRYLKIHSRQFADQPDHDLSKILPKTFCKIGGFTNLANYMAQTIGSDNFPGTRVVTHVVEYLSSEDGCAMMESLEDRCAVAVIINASIEHVCSHWNGALSPKKETEVDWVPVPKLRRALLQAVRNKSILTMDEWDLWDSWSSAILRIIDSKSSPDNIRPTGWLAFHDLIDWSAEAVPLHEKVVVQGAGTNFVNGAYTPGESLDKHGEASYTRVVPDGFGQDSGLKLTLFRCIMRSHQRWWFISATDEEHPGTYHDRDFYQKKSSSTAAECAPSIGWTTAKEGAEPPPTLLYSGTLGLPKEKSLPFKFCAWFHGNDLFAKAQADKVYHVQVVHGQKPRIQAMVLLFRYGMSKEAQQFGLPQDGSQRFEQLLQEMTSSKPKVEELKSSNSASENETAVKALEKIVENILTKEDEKYRKIKVQNPSFRKRLGGLVGGDPVMKSAGFTIQEENGEQVYSHHGSVFGLLALRAALWKDPAPPPRPAAAAALPARDMDETEEDMVQEAIRRSVQDLAGNNNENRPDPPPGGGH